MATPLDARLRNQLADLQDRALLRDPPPIEHRNGVCYQVRGRPVVGFCSNDYLGLGAELVAPRTAPAGATASRLICGDTTEHRTLEHTLAELVGAEAAVLFPSGFQLNVGVLPALLTPDDRVFSDALNHASLIDGLRLARAPIEILPHGAPPPPPTGAALTWWVTEAVFSMDGDRVDTAALRHHLDAHGCAYIDDAHSFGLFDGGAGYPTSLGIEPTVYVGTLSKAIGCAGAFVAGSALLCTWLRNRARSFVFSTAVSPLVTTRLLDALDHVRGPHGDRRRARLWANVERLAHQLGLSEAPSPIFPLLVGDNQLVLDLGAELLARGWHVQPIRPPTVPPGTARLRLSVSASHDPEQIDALIADLRMLFDRRSLPLRVVRGLTRDGTVPDGPTVPHHRAAR